VNALTNRAVSRLTTPMLVGVVTVVSTAAVLIGPAPLPVAGGLLLGFVLPGLALTDLLFRHRTLSAVERTVLTPALSLAVLVLSGLLLYVSGVHLDRTSWTLAAAGVTMLALVAEAVRERTRQNRDGYEHDGADEAAGARIPVAAGRDAPTELIPVIRDGDPPPAGLPKKPRPAPPPGPFAQRSPEQRLEIRRVLRQLLPMVLVLTVLAGAGYLSYVSSHESYDVTVTSLSAAPPGPVNAAGVHSVEVTAGGLVDDAGPYLLRVTDSVGGRVTERAVPVDDDGVWSAVLALPADERVTVGLFRAGDVVAYRSLIVAAAQ
jgi:hypothetical protein